MCKINFKKVEPPKLLPQDFKTQDVVGQFAQNFETDFPQSFLRTPDKTFNVNPFQFDQENEISFVKTAFPLELDVNLGYIPKPIEEETISFDHQVELPLIDPLEEAQLIEDDEDDEDDFEGSPSPSSPSSSSGSIPYSQFSPTSNDSSPPHSSFHPNPNNMQYAPIPPSKKIPECASSTSQMNKKRSITKTEPPTADVDHKPQVPPPKRRVPARNPKISDEKRERNRLAAEKYRKKGRDTIVTLERACHQLSAENVQLKDKSQMLEQQVQQLKTILLQYGVSKDLLDAVGLSL